MSRLRLSSTANRFASMANERVRGNDIGPTGLTVGSNVARVRKSQQLSLQDVADKLTSLGRRISLSGLSKIERGERRADVDDLMALAIALDVSPLALLLPVVEEPGADTRVTGALGSAGLFWAWALAERTPFSQDDRSFVARSLPWWLDSNIELAWYGNLDLAMGVGDAEPEVVETHFYTAKTPSDVRWSRRPGGNARGTQAEGDDGVDQATP